MVRERPSGRGREGPAPALAARDSHQVQGRKAPPSDPGRPGRKGAGLPPCQGGGEPGSQPSLRCIPGVLHLE
eukprot:13618603-Alexandrium_andersonii.AAC.1